MRKLVVFICLLSFVRVELFAQVQQESINDFFIRTVMFYNKKKEQSFPMIPLNGTEKLLLQFDNLSSQYGNYTYTVEHCNADWTISSISVNDYLVGFNKNFITNYRFSSNTLQPYVHYELELPNQDIQFRISGNYILKVYSVDNEQQVIFSRRFVLYQNLIGITTELRRSTVVNDRNKKQKIDIKIYNQDFNIDNPFDQFKVLVMQNNNWNQSFLNTRPSFYDQSSLTFDHVDANVFNGLNEHRRFDIRSTRFLSERLARIDNDSIWDIYVIEDKPKNIYRYVEELDLNGNYFIDRSDLGNGTLNGDYVSVHFTFNYGTQNPYGNYYILGRFNNWQADENSLMKYNLRSGRYENSIYLKQGIYDYMIAFKSNKSDYIDYTPIEGNFFETENDYRILAYYRSTGSRFDEVVGIRELNINP